MNKDEAMKLALEALQTCGVVDYEQDFDHEKVDEARWQRQYFARLSRNPDCRDPDHPGCEDCEETDGDSNE